MKFYIAREFRAKVKEALDLTEKDEEVFIKRLDKFYKLSLAHNQERCKEEYEKL